MLIYLKELLNGNYIAVVVVASANLVMLFNM